MVTKLENYFKIINFIRNFNPAENNWNNTPGGIFTIDMRKLSPADKGMLEAIKMAYTVEHPEYILDQIRTFYRGVRSILF